MAGQFTYGYDELSRRTSLNRPNGVVTSYSYDNLSRLLSVLHKQGGTTVIDGATYTLDNAGNRTAKTNHLTGTTEDYVYDSIYQLKQVNQGGNTIETYSYDNVGNRTASHLSSSYVVNSSNELTATDTATYTYDENGNTITKTDSSGTTTYNWDFENRLTSVVLPGNGGTVSFKYDPFGRRIQKASSSATTNYAYDGAGIVEEVDGAGLAGNRYSQGTGIDEPLALTSAGSTDYFQVDGVRSIIDLADGSGTTAQVFNYDAYGNTLNSVGGIANPFRYTGWEWDENLHFYSYRTRYIDSDIGRFFSEDKLRYEAGPNFFKYVDNDPIAFADPYGFRKMPPVPILPPESVVIAAEYWDQFAKGLGKMWANYKAMRNVNTIGVDKYYHCMAHCESASQGPGGRAASQVVSELREDFDYWKGDPPGDSVKDIQANRCGRFGGPDCKGTCRKLAPPWFKP